MADNANFVRSLLEAWNRRDWEYIKASTAADSVLTVIGTGETFHGPEGFHQSDKMWADAFPDAKITEDRIIEAGDLVVVEYTGRGTNTGPMVTSAGTVPATGRSVTLQFCDIFEVKNGKVQARRSYGDTGALMTQLGLITAQTAATQ